MIRKLIMVGMLAMFLSTTTSAFAEDVFVTQRGKKYHKQECRLIKNKENVVKLEKKEALEKGYEPCKRCFKEDVVVDEGKKGQDRTEKTK